MIPPCYNRPPRLEGMLMPTGQWTRAKYVNPGRLLRRMRWVPAFSADRCSQHDGGGVGPNGECYADAQGFECAGCRWEPEHIKAKREANPLPGILKVIEENNLRPAIFDLSIPTPPMPPSVFERLLHEKLAWGDTTIGNPWGYKTLVMTEAGLEMHEIPEGQMFELPGNVLGDEPIQPYNPEAITPIWPVREQIVTDDWVGDAMFEPLEPGTPVWLGFDPASGPDQTAYYEWPIGEAELRQPWEEWKNRTATAVLEALPAVYGHAPHCNLMFPATLGTEDDHCDCGAVDKPVDNHEVIYNRLADDLQNVAFLKPRQQGKTAALARALSDTRDMVDHLTGLRPSEMRSSPAFAKGGIDDVRKLLTERAIEFTKRTGRPVSLVCGDVEVGRVEPRHYKPCGCRPTDSCAACNPDDGFPPGVYA